jgi:VWFA-related protein
MRVLFGSLAWAVLISLPGAQPGISQEPTIRATARLVTLDVVAAGKDGKPVADLTAENFVVLDNGKARNVRPFRAGKETEADLASSGSRGAAERMRLPDPLPAGLHTNLRQAESMPSRATVILLDALNTSVEDQLFAKSEIAKFLRNLPEGEPVGIYVLTSQLRIVHALSADSESLIQGLNRKPENTGANVETESAVARTLDGAKLNQILADATVREMVEFQIVADQNVALARLSDRIERTFGALESIAHHLAPVAGRKSLLWVSAAFPMVVSSDIRTGTGSPVSFEAASERAFRALTAAGVSVYPIDARGLLVDPLYRAKDSYTKYAMGQVLGASRSRGNKRGGRATFTSPDPLVYAERDETTAHHDIMQDLAKRTGGKAFFDSNAVSRAAREAIADGAGSYTLGFYPGEGDADFDGRFHRLQVKVNGVAGVSVRHREGYYAGVAKPGADSMRRESMWNLMTGPLTSGAIPLAVQAVPLDRAKLRVVVRINPEAVTMREVSSRWTGELEIVLLYTDERGNRKGTHGETLRLDLSAGERGQALDAGVNYRVEAPVMEGSRFLTVGVRDNADGRVGTVRIDLGEILPK